MGASGRSVRPGNLAAVSEVNAWVVVLAPVQSALHCAPMGVARPGTA